MSVTPMPRAPDDGVARDRRRGLEVTRLWQALAGLANPGRARRRAVRSLRLARRKGTVVDGPFIEGKELIGG